MVQVYPEKVAALPAQQLQTLLQTLEYGVNSSEPEAVQSALEALAALAKFDFQSKKDGQSGLPAEPGEARQQPQTSFRLSIRVGVRLEGFYKIATFRSSAR